MKTGIKAAIIMATLLTGTLGVEAQQQIQPKGQRSGNRIHQCPNCGWSPQRQAGRNTQIRRQRPLQSRRFRNQGPQQPGRGNYQIKAKRGQSRPQWSPQQRQQALQRHLQFQNQQNPNKQNPQFQRRQGRNRIQQNPLRQQQVQEKRQQIIKRFDADEDGQLSENERAQMRAAWKQHQKKQEAENGKQPPPQPIE